jgi:hypothetical protein
MCVGRGRATKEVMCSLAALLQYKCRNIKIQVQAHIALSISMECLTDNVSLSIKSTLTVRYPGPVDVLVVALIVHTSGLYQLPCHDVFFLEKTFILGN